MSMQSIGKYIIFLLLIIVGIYAAKWVNTQYKIPVIGEVIEGV